jgi:ABC-2 type transport system ATP-binding protein
MIEVSGLTKIYGRTIAIQDVSFSVAKGEILGFLGPNGAGKTTTMRILTGHTPPTSGIASVAGFDVVADSLEVRRRIGYLPETIGLYEDMTVDSYLLFMAEVKGVGRERRKGRMEAVIEETGLSSCANRLIRNISKGFRQRLGLAQALIADPEVLILDEPTIGLDPAQIREIRTLIKAMEGRKTIILSTHILAEVTAICNRIAIINLGRLAVVGTPEELSRRLGAVGRLSVLAAGDPVRIRRAIEGVPGVHSVLKSERAHEGGHLFHVDVSLTRHSFSDGARKDSDPRKEIVSALVAAGCDLLELTTEGVSLEDVYMRVVMGDDGKQF